LASSLSDLIGRLKKVWNGLSPMQRWLSIGLSVALALSVGVAWYLQRPQWEVFYKATEPDEVASLTEKLDELSVQYRVTGDGLTITVPSSERSAANLAKAQAGLPTGGVVGMEIFDQVVFGATEFDKKVAYERAAEGELARAIMHIREIQHATVNLNIPEKSVFVRDRAEPTASVLVQPRAGATLTKDNVLAIMNYVAYSVDGLTPERVTVINDKGITLSTGLANPDQAAIDDEALAQQRTREQQLQGKILSVLEPLFGVGNVAASVNVELDLAATRIEERIVGQGVPKVEEKVQSGATTTSSGTGGTPATGAATGTDGTTATPPPVNVATGSTSNASTDEYNNKTTTQYDYGERNEVTVSPAGAPKRISAAITINRKELSAAQIEQIQQLAANATGATITDVAVVAMSFTPLASDLANQPAAEPTPPIQPLTLALGLGLAAVFLIIAAFLTRRRKHEPAVLIPGVAAQAATGTTLDVALGLDQQAAPAGQTAATAAMGVQPEIDAQAAGVAHKLEEVLKKRKPKRTPLDVEDILDDDILADIDVLIEQAPEACAEVIRQWLKGGI